MTFHRLRRLITRALTWLALGFVTALLVCGLAILGLAEWSAAGLRAAQRERLGLTSNRLLRLHQRVKEAGEKTSAAIRIAGEGF